MEIFSSVQGEGMHVGLSTLFVRFGECDLRCRWCDSPHTWRPATRCRIETSRGSGTFREVANPVTLDALLAAAEDLQVSRHRMVSLTGGEPLLQPQPVAAAGRELRARGPRVLLETHGVAVAALEQVLGNVDVVSMDWKLTSDVRRASDPKSGEPEPFHAEHERFLRTARAGAEVVVKVVLTTASTDAELDEMAERVAGVDPTTPLIVQPVTPFGPVRERPSAARVLEVERRLSRLLSEVRVVPQTHRSYGAL